MRPSSILTIACSLVVLAACGSGSSGTGGAGGTSSASSSSTGGAGGSATASSSGGSGGAATTSSSSGAGGAAPIQSCAEISADDCFSNLDCMAADRCENKGTPDLSVPCCVPGARGTGKSGEACSIDNDCETSLCVETTSGFQCAGECAMDSDCPPSMPTCTSIPAILGQGSFCLPT